MQRIRPVEMAGDMAPTPFASCVSVDRPWPMTTLAILHDGPTIDAMRPTLVPHDVDRAVRLPIAMGDRLATREGRVDLMSLDVVAMEAFVAELGEKRFRALQIYRWLHQRGARSFDEMTDLKKEFRTRLAHQASIDLPTIEAVQQSSDGTRKYQLRTSDGHTIEAVYIPRASGPTRNALCISSQIGCAMGCTFCATASIKLVRHLTPGEIAGQYHVVTRDLVENGLGGVAPANGKPARPITNIVYMGMGEPLHNFEGVVRSIRLLTEENGPELSPRRITVSTSGIVPAIARLGAETDVHIAISLNGTTDDVRTSVMPVNKRWNLDALLDACRRFPLARRRRITFEYVMLKGVTDSDDDARRLVRLLDGLRTKVNLIPFNAHPLSPYARPTAERVDAFRAILERGDMSVFVRTTRGGDIDAACGMLGAKKLEEKRRETASASSQETA
jgi:23S rRNA (adenine2503-C2)-methyltransferase